MGRYRSLMLPLSVFVPIYKSPVSVMATEVNKDIAGFNLSGVTLILWTGTSHVYPPPSLSLSLSLRVVWYKRDVWRVISLPAAVSRYAVMT